MMAALVSQGAPGDQWEVRVVTSCVTTRDGEMGSMITPARGRQGVNHPPSLPSVTLASVSKPGLRVRPASLED